MKIFKYENDFVGFFLVITFCIITIYLLPNAASLVYFAVLLIFFYRSKKDYFWFALILFLVDPPGRLFPNRDYNYCLPLYYIFPGADRYIWFQELFIFVALIKALAKRQVQIFFLRNAFILLFIYVIILFFLSLFMGMSFMHGLNALRLIFPYTLLFSIPVLLNSQGNWERFFKLLFPLVLINFSLQIYEILNGTPFANLFGTDFIGFNDSYGSYYDQLRVGDYSGIGSRVFFGYVLCYLSALGAMFYSVTQTSRFKRSYLNLILIISYFSIAITATRGYILSISIIYIMYFYFLLKARIFRLLIPLSILVFVFTTNPFLQRQTNFIFQRFKVEENYSGASMARYNTYMPEQLKVWKESPLFGWGFSDTFYQNANGHVGITNLLLNGGIIGFLLFFYLWLLFILRVRSTSNKISFENPYKRGLIVLNIGMLGLIIIHSTSNQIFGYLIGYENIGLGLLLFLGFANFELNDSLSTDALLVKND